MKTKKKIKVLRELRKFVRNTKEKGHDSYTCQYLESKTNHSSKIVEWYDKLLRNLYRKEPRLMRLLPKDIVEDFQNPGYGVIAPFNAFDYENRLVMLNYLIKKYRKKCKQSL